MVKFIIIWTQTKTSYYYGDICAKSVYFYIHSSASIMIKGLVSKGRGYEFDACARLGISTTTPSSIFSKFFPKITKSVDFTGVFYCLKWRPGQNLKFDQFFSAKPNIFWFFSLKNDRILDSSQTLLIITFFAGKRSGGVCLCPKGLISTKIFALALTVLEIFAKNHFQKNWHF